MLHSQPGGKVFVLTAFLFIFLSLFSLCFAKAQTGDTLQDTELANEFENAVRDYVGSMDKHAEWDHAPSRFPSFVIIVLAIGLIFIPADTIVHEAGHALAILLTGREKIRVFIGSHGKETRLSLPIPKGKVYFSVIPWHWNKGLVTGASSGTLARSLLISFSGPFASVVFSWLVVYPLMIRTSNEPYYLLGFMMGVHHFSFLTNIIPSGRPITIHGGGITYNDGYQILQDIKLGNHRNTYLKAAEFYNDKKYEEAARLFSGLSKAQPGNEQYFMYTIASLSNAGKFNEALQWLESSSGSHSKDIVSLKATLHLQTGNYLQASDILYSLDEAERMKLHNLHSLIHAEICLENFEKAQSLIDKAVKEFPGDNRTLEFQFCISIGTGDYEKAEALKLDLEKSDEIRDSDWFTFNSGVLFLKRGEFPDALVCLKRAKELNPSLKGLDELISSAEENLEKKATDGD